MESAPALYLHVPFCSRACPYCDFDFEVAGSRRLPQRIDAWLAGLEAERAARKLGGLLRTVYLGGGTPSLLGEEGLSRLFAWIDEHFDRSRVLECTVELNPEHVDAALLETMRALGVGRVSLGVQSLSTRGLAQLGRVHDRARALESIAACVESFECSVDFIIGWAPEQASREEELLRELEAVEALGVGHLSLYALTIEPGSAWPGLVSRGLRAEVDEDAQTRLLESAERWLVSRGWSHYEVSSYAKPGREAVHNQAYWTGRDYLGLGPSASSATYRELPTGCVVERRSNPRGLDAWLACDLGAVETERVEGEAAAGEALWLALRQLEGIEVDPILGRFSQVDRGWLDRRISRQLERGNLVWEGQGRVLRVAPGRWIWHDSIALDLVAPEEESR
jgi:oxygen-independent coproporphyrinogen-3 oxidase